MSAPVTTCPRCTTVLRHRGTHSYCPRCLVHTALSLPSVARLVKGAQAPSPEEIAPLFPDFEIVELLGAGGMGLVYLARQVKLDRLVALKLLPDDPSTIHAEFTERFEREARSLARINHSDFVQIYEQGKVTGWYYLVMEFVDGPDLSRVLKSEGALAPVRAIALFTRLCHGLAEAHRLGIVHRDLKPANLLVNREDVLKVADFGLAKLLDRPDESFTLTSDRAALGTPYYISPEQRTGSAEIDQRADIYSLGVIFYEMLTGALPTGNFKPPSQLTAVSPTYDRIIRKALAGDPDDRFGDLGEMIAALEKARRKPVPLTLTLTVLLVLLAVGTSLFVSNRGGQDAPPTVKTPPSQPAPIPSFDWSKALILASPNPGEAGYFGSFGDIVDDFLVLGAPGDGQFGPQTDLPGKVHLYRFDDESPPELLATLQAPIPQPRDHFGAVLDLSPDGKELLVFARQLEDDHKPWVVYCYHRGGEGLGSWNLRQTLTFESRFSDLGDPVRAVSDGAWMAVTSPAAPASQALRMYRRTDEGWIYHSTLDPEEDLHAGSQFGFQSRFHGGQLFVGAPKAGTGAAHFSGALFVFAQDENGDWRRQQKLTSSAKSFFGFFGTDWSFPARDQLLVGCMGDPAGGALGTGSVFKFQQDSSSGLWELAGSFSSPDPKVGRAGFGQQLVADGDGLLAVHASQGSPGDRSLRSLTHVFTLSADPAAPPKRLVRLRPTEPEIWLGRPLFSGRHLIIGAPNASNVGVEASGRVYLCPKSALRRGEN